MWNSGMINIGRPEQGNATENEERGGVNKNQNINQDFILFLTYITDFLNICCKRSKCGINAIDVDAKDGLNLKG